MRLRPPSVPLITIDPYFSVWSPAVCLTNRVTEHWTGSPNTLDGTVTVDGTTYTFMGKGQNSIKQTAIDLTAMVTTYTFENSAIELTAEFFSPLLITDLYLVSRPVSYLNVSYKSKDGAAHNVSVEIAASEELCLDKKGTLPVEVTALEENTFKAMKMGAKEQAVLNRSGDDIRIDWGYFYLACPKNGTVGQKTADEMTFVTASAPLTAGEKAMFLFAYDDIESIQYFNQNLKAYWHSVDADILTAMQKAQADYSENLARCREFEQQMTKDAVEAGGEKYADMLNLAYRQVLAAHKLVVDPEGQLLYISKECNSNGCAATVDVTYPSAPMFLLYNPELLKGMLRPVFHYEASKDWEYDFAPHDIGRYPLLNGQAYCQNRLEGQMPVEECGNMLILMACLTLCDKNADFAKPYFNQLEQWTKYLEKYGTDPGNQLCTDDFGGHIAHNCNLALKAIMGIAGYSIILSYLGDDRAEKYMDIAKKMADEWVENAANEDGSFRLTFDQPGTFSMKYNMVWDVIWGTNLFAPCVKAAEFLSYQRHMNVYGLPLDNRHTWSKTDWLVWCACLTPYKSEFESFIAPLWDAFNLSESRVPMMDWYSTVSANRVSFKARTVQGGLFIKLLDLKFNKN